MASIGLILVTAAVLFEFRGFTGDLLPIIRPRWHAEETLDNHIRHIKRATAKLTDTELAEQILPSRNFTEIPKQIQQKQTPEVAAQSDSDYPQFLGPLRNAIVHDTLLEQDWKARPPQEVWRRELGTGWSSFAVKNGVAVTQEQRGPNELVTAYDLETGRSLWVHETHASFHNTLAGSGPRATPTISDGKVYAMGATGILTALELETGHLIWSRDVLQDNHANLPEWGKSCSPLAIDGKVVVSAGGPDGRSLVAYSQLTGDLVWQAGDDRSGYSSPLITTLAGVRQIIIFNEASVAAHDPLSGRILWVYPWPAGQPTVAQPLILSNDRVLLSSGYGIGSKLLQVTRTEDDRLEARMLWESTRLKAKFTNLVEHSGYIYGLDDGVLTCVDVSTGERRWKEGRYGHGQLILVEDLLLIQAESGEIVLAKPNPEKWVELGRFQALAEKTWNNPALVGPYLLVRNDQHAACYKLPLKN